MLDPASGTDNAGRLKTTQYNDFANLRWFGATRGSTALVASGQAGTWFCVEAHAKPNDAGQSKGVTETWINGAVQVEKRYFDNIVVATERIGC